MSKGQVPLGIRFLAGFVRSVLWFRYRVRAAGLKEVLERGRTGILFLQNHPALIDPVVVTSQPVARNIPPEAVGG